jgi:hypothetical protein
MKLTAIGILLFLFASVQAQNTNLGSRSIQTTVDPFLSNIAVSDSGVQCLLLWLDEIEKQLNAEKPDKGAVSVHTSNLNLSKSNINRTRSDINKVSMALDRLKSSTPDRRSDPMAALHKAVKELETPILELHTAIVNCGRAYAAKAAELKTRHDTVKSSINNIR